VPWPNFAILSQRRTEGRVAETDDRTCHCFRTFAKLTAYGAQQAFSSGSQRVSNGWKCVIPGLADSDVRILRPGPLSTGIRLPADQ
jgi:hypothetical protein